MSAWQGRASASERVPRADGWAAPAGKVSLAASHLASRGHARHSSQLSDEGWGRFSDFQRFVILVSLFWLGKTLQDVVLG